MLSNNGNSKFSFGKSLYLPILLFVIFGFSAKTIFAQGALAPKIEDIKFISMLTNNVAYLDAFPINTEFKVRVIGKNLGNLILKPSLDLIGRTSTPFITVVREISAVARANQKEFVIKFRNTGEKEFRVKDFYTKSGNTEKPMLDFQREFNSSNLPTCQIYDKANLLVVNNSINGIYDRPTNQFIQCGPLNTNLGSHRVTEDKYCTKNVPNPTLEAPLQQKEVRLAPITFKIKNNSFAPILKPFKVKIKNGINTIKEITVNKMIAQEEKTLTFTRDEQRKIFVRHRDCPNCFEKLEAPFNWVDVPLNIVIDEENVTGATKTNSQIRGTNNP